MYNSVKSRVKYCNSLSEPFNYILGVRQGECLSPFLFAMFLNDIEDMYIHSGMHGIDVNMFKIFLILYADDIVLFANTENELQNSLDMLYEYCNKWKLVVNTDKTKIMIFRKGGRLNVDTMFYYNNCPVEVVNKFTYLGIVFTTGGSFSEAQNTLSGQAQKAIFKMNKYLYKFTNISVQHRLELFDKLVLPILNYSSEVCGFIHGNAIERTHLSFCKQLLGVKKSTQNDFIYGELGRLSLQSLRFYNIVKYWTKIVCTNENKYVAKVYLMLKNDLDQFPNKKNWCSLVRDLLCNLGLNDAWFYQNVGNANVFLSLVKQRIKDQFIQNWTGRLNDSSRALFYRCIAQFQLQPYLKCIGVRKFCTSMTKLRCSSHRLCIETGRWARPASVPINERKCTFCNVLEDEFHFVLQCRMYSQLRTQYIPICYWRSPNMCKFIELMNTENQLLIRKLSIYISKAFVMRSDILYGAD